MSWSQLWILVACLCRSWFPWGTKKQQPVIPFSIIWHRSCVPEHMTGAAMWTLMFTWVEGMSMLVHRRQILWSVLHKNVTVLTREAWDMHCWKLGTPQNCHYMIILLLSSLSGICLWLLSQAGYWSFSCQAVSLVYGKADSPLISEWSMSFGGSRE